MRTILILSGLLAGSPVIAQENTVESAQESAAKVHYQALTNKVQKAATAWREEQQRATKKAAEEAKRSGKKSFAMKAISMTPPNGKFVPEFQDAAKQYAGQDGAVPFLLWIVTHGSADKDAQAAAIATLTREHRDSDRIQSLPATVSRMSRQLGAARIEAILSELAQSSNERIKAQVVFARTMPIAKRAAVGSPAYEQAKLTLANAVAESGDEALERELAGLVRGERLKKGQIAPDIQGVDLDGVEFKLTDYAGKVVLLDFWGDW